MAQITPKNKSKIIRRRTVKKAPKTLFGKQIEHSPEAHKMCVALNMAGLHVDIPIAHAILRVFKKMNEMGGKFDLSTATDIRVNTEEEYQLIAEKHYKQKTKKSKS